MKFCCYGVCGSRPVPPSTTEIVSMFSRIILQIGKKKILSCGDDKDALLKLIHKEIPKESLHTIFGVGGNSPTVELFPTEKLKLRILFDLGTGITKINTEKGIKEFHVFVTHFHYDHVQGLPFNHAFYNKDIKVHFYSPVKGFENIFHDLMKPPYFPVGMYDIMTPNVFFHEIGNKSSIKIDNMTITWMPIPHPGGSYAYKVTDGKRTFCYFTDVSMNQSMFEDTKRNREFLKDIDSMILDASMDFVDSILKRYWGHSSLFDGLNFCKKWNIKKMYMFHRDPTLTINDVNLNYQTALWYNKSIKSSAKVFLAQEDVEFAV